MNGNDIISGIGELPEELLETKAKRPRKRAMTPVKWIAVAAALLIVCGSVTAGAVAASRGKFDFLKNGSNGYSAVFELNKYKWSEFNGGITEAPEIIRQQYAAYTPQPAWSSLLVSPGSFGRRFNTQREAVDYVGLKALKTTYFPYKNADWSANVIGDGEGRISEVELFAQTILSDENGMGAAAFVTILTEHSEKNTVSNGGDWGDYDPGSMDFEEFTTSSGRLCQYAKVGVPDKAYQCVTGYIEDSGIIYSLHLNFPAGGLDRAMEELQLWAESF